MKITTLYYDTTNRTRIELLKATVSDLLLDNCIQIRAYLSSPVISNNKHLGVIKSSSLQPSPLFYNPKRKLTSSRTSPIIKKKPHQLSRNIESTLKISIMKPSCKYEDKHAKQDRNILKLGRKNALNNIQIEACKYLNELASNLTFVKSIRLAH